MIRLDPRLPKSMFTDSKRLQQIIKNLLSNAFKFTHYGRGHADDRAGDRRLERRQRGPEPRPRGARVFGHRHRDRHRAGQAANHLRGVPAGRRQHQPQVRRHRPGPGDQPGAVAPAARRDPPGQHARQGQHVHALPAGQLPAAAHGAQGIRCGLGCAGRDRNRAAQERAAPTRERRHHAAKPALAIASAESRAAMLVNEVGRRPGQHSARRPRAADRRERRAVRALPAGHRARKRLQGLVTSLGAAALAMAQEYKPSAITLDISLPDIEGWRVLERLKNDIAHRHMPVYVVSTEEAAERALAAGARGFLAKPIQSKDLLDRLLDEIKSYAERKRRQRAGGRGRRAQVAGASGNPGRRGRSRD